MSIILIQSNSSQKRQVNSNSIHLKVSEFFSDTIQGEGISSGVSATFLRLQNCTLSCCWCDTTEVWKVGNPYTVQELLDLIEESRLYERLQTGQHLILTGGSPLLQDIQLVYFIEQFILRFNFKPFIEVENECVKIPSDKLIELVDQWNNSPKLNNSGMRKELRYKEDIIRFTSQLRNSWFKFVISDESEIEEVVEDFFHLINRNQIILMPCGDTQEKLNRTRPIVADLACKYGLRFSDRLHVTCWDKKTGV